MESATASGLSSGPSPAAPLPLGAYRSRFPILDTSIYLISNSLGAVPMDVGTSLNEYFTEWARRGVRAWEERWWTLVEAVGSLVAPLIGAGAGQVVFQPNVTLTHGIIFSAFRFGADRSSGAGRPETFQPAAAANGASTDLPCLSRRKIVTDAMHFPSILYLIGEQAGYGAEVVVVPSDDGIGVSTEALIDAIDADTACVAISHVLFKTAYIHDIAAIARRAHEVDALVVVDGYQAVGTIPVDVNALGVDVYIGGCLKWLCGGPGNAFSWVRPELAAALSPRLTGWMSHARPFDFSPTLERRTDAWRFLHGTPGIPSLFAAMPGLKIIAEVGLDRVREHSQRQTARLIELADAQGWRVAASRDASRRGGTVAMDIPHGYEVSKALKARDVVCDFRPDVGVRLSPHFYTLDDELDAAADAIQDILASGAWQAFAGAKSTVT